MPEHRSGGWERHAGGVGASERGRALRKLRVTAAPLWMRAVVTPAALRFQAACPGVGLTLRTVTFAEGVRRLANGASDLHCGGIDDERSLVQRQVN